MHDWLRVRTNKNYRPNVEREEKEKGQTISYLKIKSKRFLPKVYMHPEMEYNNEIGKI